MEKQDYRMEIDGGELVMPKIEVQKVTDGLGFGEGVISFNARENEIGKEKIITVENAIVSGELLVPIATNSEGIMIDDDGCGDGRLVSRVYHGEIEKDKSLIRPKVFGGGPAMATAASIGLGSVVGRPLQESFSNGISLLKRSKVDFGGHTDSHSHGPNCGCGALDKAPLVIANVKKYASQIADTIMGLGIETDGLDEVIDNFKNYATEIENDESEYSGAVVMGEVIDSAKIVKELDGTHNEMFIILNDVENHTIDQDLVRELSDGDIQAFVVDVWRLRSIADRIYADNTPEIRQKALLSELVYSLGVSATLTKGDLPVYAVSHQSEPVAA